jgi:hypothetical protein
MRRKVGLLLSRHGKTAFDRNGPTARTAETTIARGIGNCVFQAAVFGFRHAGLIDLAKEYE